jgi:hypothetical protein
MNHIFAFTRIVKFTTCMLFSVWLAGQTTEELLIDSCEEHSYKLSHNRRVQKVV